MKTTVRQLKDMIREAAIVGTYPETAEEYAHVINDEIKSRGSWGGLATDPDYWTKMGVHTGEELARYLAIEGYINAYKDAYGFKPRGFDFSNRPPSEIDAMTDQLYDDALNNDNDDFGPYDEPEPEPKDFQTPSLTHNPFAGLK